MGVILWLGNVCDRQSRVLAVDEVLDIGDKRLRHLGALKPRTPAIMRRPSF